MSRLTKNVLVVFTLLCAIMLIVFCIELIIVNWNSNSEEPTPSLSVSSPEGNVEKTDEPEVKDSEPPVSTDSPEITDDNGGDVTQETENQPPAGKQYQLPMLDDIHTLMLYASEELFEYSEGGEGGDWLFTFLGDGKASLEVASDFITPPGGINALAEKLLINYLDGGEPTVGGERQIGKSSLQGVFVSGDKRGETYEAWIYGPFGGGETGQAVVFVINFANGVQRDAIYTIIDTMEMVAKEEEE